MGRFIDFRDLANLEALVNTGGALAIILVYYAIGIWYYTEKEGWTFIESMFFITGTITTVGFGYNYPTTNSSQIFTIFYIFFGLLSVYAILNARIQEQIIKIEARFLNQDFMVSERVHEITRQIFSLLYYALGIFIITMVGAGIIHNVRNQAGSWDFTESLYFSFVTITAIGYGDLPLEGEDIMAFLVVFMVCTVTLTTVFIEKIGILLYQFREFRRRDKIDKMVISADLLRRFNPKGKVSALEFLVGMLTYGDVVDKEKNIDPILRKFIELDKDKTGILNVERLSEWNRSIEDVARDTSDWSSFQVVYEDMCDVWMGRRTLRGNDDESEIETEVQSPMQDGEGDDQKNPPSSRSS